MKVRRLAIVVLADEVLLRLARTIFDPNAGRLTVALRRTQQNMSPVVDHLLDVRPHGPEVLTFLQHSFHIVSQCPRPVQAPLPRHRLHALRHSHVPPPVAISRDRGVVIVDRALARAVSLQFHLIELRQSTILGELEALHVTNFQV